MLLRHSGLPGSSGAGGKNKDANWITKQLQQTGKVPCPRAGGAATVYDTFYASCMCIPLPSSAAGGMGPSWLFLSP